MSTPNEQVVHHMSAIEEQHDEGATDGKSTKKAPGSARGTPNEKN
jgi:hypothetical protein